MLRNFGLFGGAISVWAVVTLLCFLKRKAGTSPAEFAEHWRERHGPLITSTPEIAQHIERYEQYSPSPAMPGFGTEGYDGITVMSFGSPEAFNAFLAEPAYAEKIYPDEDAFLDRHGLVWMVADEPNVVIAGDP